LEQSAREALLYMQGNPVTSLLVALVTGFAACRSVASDWKGFSLLFIFIGFAGFFFGQFMVLFVGLKEVIDQIPQFAFLFDLVIGFIGSFVVATIVNFFKPI